jgi:hypothetical protein
MRPVSSPSTPPPRRRGDARWMALLAVVLLGVVGWLLLGDGVPPREAREGATVVQPAADPTPEPESRSGPDRPGPELERRDEAPAAVAGGPGLPAGARPAPDGRPIGVLRGRLTLRGAAELQGPWTLVLEPSRFAVGAQLAEARTLELPADQRDFEVRDLPLAGYDVRAAHPGMNGRAQPVILRRGSEQAYLVVELSPAAAVTGKLVDAEGFGQADVEVHLRPADTSLDQSTTSDALGDFRFDGVIDGPYTLRVGDAQAPLLEPLSLQVRAPRLTLPSIELPPLGTLFIDVVDLEGRAVPDAEVLGGGTLGGRVDARTDGRGRATVKGLPAGQYSLRVRVEGLGKGFARANVNPAAGDARARVVLRP